MVDPECPRRPFLENEEATNLRGFASGGLGKSQTGVMGRRGCPIIGQTYNMQLDEDGQASCVVVGSMVGNGEGRSPTEIGLQEGCLGQWNALSRGAGYDAGVVGCLVLHVGPAAVLLVVGFGLGE
ncbi:hypothetical protein LX36DRAFT_666276 [Colletotrichum falcatum]|nr:hypothetical protein LX36DRAFT_666276 [Colletotrichum falcatum]